jgi:hypothetical protein
MGMNRSALGFEVLLAAFFLFSSCDKPVNRPPTVTEIFHLRSECAALGEKIQNREGAIRMRSRYDPATNRCLVELTEGTTAHYTHGVMDGQTGELLASTITRTDPGGHLYMSGTAKNLPPGVVEPEDRYRVVEDLITSMMADDRKP